MPVLCLSFLIALLDQVTKWLVREHFVPGEMTPLVPGFFDLAYIRNTGAAWGMLAALTAGLPVFRSSCSS